MVKIARCGYGSDGRAMGKGNKGYIYLVNDNVRKGDKLRVLSTSVAGRKFMTTGVPQNIYSNTSKKGIEARTNAEAAVRQKTELYSGANGEETQVQRQGLTRAYTGAELGLPRGRAMYGAERQKYVDIGTTRRYKYENPGAVYSKKTQETYESYASRLDNKGGNQ